MKTLKIFDLKSYQQIFELDWSPSLTYRKGLNNILKIGYSSQSKSIEAKVYDLSSSKLIASDNLPCPINSKLH